MKKNRKENGVVDINNNVTYTNNVYFFSFKVKGLSFLYILKTFFFIQKKFNNFVFNFFFLPKKNKQIVVLRSPFIYKYSRLKFNFTTSTGILNLKLFVNQKNKILLSFLLRKMTLFLKNNMVYTFKKKVFSFFF